jgi:hypothetical protein
MNERKIILERSKSIPLVTCSMNPFQTGILGVFDALKLRFPTKRYRKIAAVI